METVLIKRQGSYFYTRAYWHLVVVLTLVYGGMGAVLAIITDPDLEGVLDQIIFPILAFVPVLMMWLVYTAMLWVFKREAETKAVELSFEGIRETYRGRERVFIPWVGVREIELNADLIGGMSLKVKGAFSEIAISNVDLEITQPISFTKMHQALSRAGEMRKLFAKLRTNAPQASLRMNNLARRRLTKYALASTDSGWDVSPSTANQDSVDFYVYFGGPIRPPEITKAKFKEGKSLLRIFGKDFTGDTRVEINGVIIDGEAMFFPGEGQLTLRGTRRELNLGSDNNQVVVIRRGTRSSAARVKG